MGWDEGRVVEKCGGEGWWMHLNVRRNVVVSSMKNKRHRRFVFGFAFVPDTDVTTVPHADVRYE